MSERAADMGGGVGEGPDKTMPQAGAAPQSSQVDLAKTADRRLISSASKSTKIRRLAWAAVEATLFRWSFHTLNGWRALLLRLFGAKVGRRCIIRRTVRVYYPWNVTIGQMCIIGDSAVLYSLGKITIGDRAMVSQEAYLCAGTHDYTHPALPLLTLPVTLGAESWICARAFVGPGVNVGAGAVVAACGVVVKDVDPWTIVGGNPAKFIKPRELKNSNRAS